MSKIKQENVYKLNEKMYKIKQENGFTRKWHISNN